MRLITRCLYVDDERDERKLYAEFLDMAWQHLTQEPLQVDVKSFEDGLTTLRTPGVTYGLVVIDIWRDKGGDKQKLGLQVIHVAQDALRSTPLLALSVGGPGVPDAVEAAGVTYASKQGVMDGQDGVAYLASRILDAFHKKGRHPVATDVDRTAETLPLTAIIEDVSVETLASLTTDILKQRPQRLTFKYVTPGLSGSAVLGVECQLSAPTPARQLLLKVSRDPGKLKAEVAKCRVARQSFGRLLVPFEDDAAECGGWYAIGAPFETGAVTLGEWLVAGHGADEIDRLFRELFLSRPILDVYKAASETTARAPRLIFEQLGTARRARIQMALEKLDGLAGRHDSTRTFDGSVLEDFLRSARVGGIDEVRFPMEGVPICLAHGDLHARNILVDGNARALLIDPSEFASRHWAADAARLCADLVLSWMDNSDRAHEWESMAAWQAAALTVVMSGPGEINDAGKRDPALAAALWLRSRLWEVHQRVDVAREWEFCLALGVEFLRGSYRTDLTAPKRVLGLLAGLAAMNHSAELWKRQHGGGAAGARSDKG